MSLYYKVSIILWVISNVLLIVGAAVEMMTSK